MAAHSCSSLERWRNESWLFISTSGIAAALLLDNALLFGERADAQYVMGIDCLNGAREIRSLTTPSATSIEPSAHLEEPESRTNTPFRPSEA